MSKIDFVILWVDDTDEKWLEEKKNFLPQDRRTNTSNRYRDWDNLRYWFRGVEKYAPWVNNIYFITYGHLPKWLNTEHPKLKVINHKDFMCDRYLPTYNSNAIELNIHKITGLSNDFVLFNDDFFIIDEVKESDFFINGVPKDEFSENPITPDGDVFSHTMFNNIEVINKYYIKKKFNRENFFKRYCIKYGSNNIRTLLLMPYKKFVGIHNPHICSSFNKESFIKLWELEPEKCENTALSKFRSQRDITQYLIRYMQLLDGNFIPRQSRFGKLFGLTDGTNIYDVVKCIANQEHKVICINDNDMDGTMDFEDLKEKINDAFSTILPDKSEYERNEI